MLEDSGTLSNQPYTHDGLENTKFELKRWPFYWLIRTSDRYEQRLEQALRNAEIDIPRWRVLMLLGATDARSVSYLAKESYIKLSTMVRIVQRMEEEGLVITRPRASDARVKEVVLTKNGRRARPLAWHQVNRIYDVAFKDMSEDEIALLNSLLEKIATNFEHAKK